MQHQLTTYLLKLPVANLSLMYQSIPSLTIPLWVNPGDSHILVAPGVGFSLLCLARGSAPGVLNLSKSSIILQKARFLLYLCSSSLHVFIYARSEQCDLGPIYIITNTQCIRIYPGKLKFILVKISWDPGRLHGKHAKKNKLRSCFLLLRIYPDLLVHTSANIPCSDLSSYAVNLPR